jgi:AcrR family transcriptional regulator
MPNESPHRLLKEKLREERAQLILDVTEAILLEKGYHDTSMDEVAAHVGIAKGTLYQHFASKEELVFALIERKIALFEQFIEQIVNSSLETRAKLERIVRYVYQERHGQYMQLIQFIHHNVDVRRNLMEKKDQLSNRLEQCFLRVKIVFDEGKAEGIFDAHISTAIMIVTFLSLLSLTQQEQLLAQEQLSSEEFITQLEQAFFQGILVRPQ